MAADESLDIERLAILTRLSNPTAHDLRGTIGNMAIQLELLQSTCEELPAAVRERIERYASVLQRERHTLSRTIDVYFGLLPQPAASNDIDAAALVQDLCDAVLPLARRCRVSLTLRRPSTPVALRLAARERTRQEILNLLLTQLGATAAGQSLTVELCTTPQTLIRVTGPDPHNPPVELPIGAASLAE